MSDEATISLEEVAKQLEAQDCSGGCFGYGKAIQFIDRDCDSDLVRKAMARMDREARHLAYQDAREFCRRNGSKNCICDGEWQVTIPAQCCPVKGTPIPASAVYAAYFFKGTCTRFL